MQNNILTNLSIIKKSPLDLDYATKINRQFNQTIEQNKIILQEIQDDIFILSIKKDLQQQPTTTKKLINHIQYILLPEENEQQNFAKLSFYTLKNVCFELKELQVDFDNYGNKCDLYLFYNIDAIEKILLKIFNSHEICIKETLSNRIAIVTNGQNSYPVALSRFVCHAIFLQQPIEHVIENEAQNLVRKLLLLPKLFSHLQEIFYEYKWISEDEKIYYIFDEQMHLLDHASVLDDIIYTGYKNRMKDYLKKFSLSQISLGAHFPTASIRSPLYLKARPDCFFEVREGHAVVATKEYQGEQSHIDWHGNQNMSLWLKRAQRHLYRHHYQAQVVMGPKPTIFSLVGEQIASIALFPPLIKAVFEKLNILAPHNVRLVAQNENVLTIAHDMSSWVDINQATNHAILLFKLISQDGCNPLSFYKQITLPSMGAGSFDLKLVPTQFFTLLDTLQKNKGTMLKGYQHYLLGLAFQCINKWELAILEFKKALRFDPKDPEILKALGHSLMEVKLVLEAMPFLKRAFEIIPDEPEIANVLGISHLECGHVDEAIFAFEKAVTLSPGCAEYLKNLGLSYVKAQRHNEAFLTLKQALHVSKNPSQIHASLAELYLACGDKQQAKLHAFQAYNEDPTNSFITDLLWQLMNDS